MTREQAIYYLQSSGFSEEQIATIERAFKQEPCGETVSLEAFKQVMWERDIAIGQLKELGYGFGQKIEPKTGHWILDETDNSITCDKCGCLIWANDISNGEAYYCPNCGARMESEVSSDGSTV